MLLGADRDMSFICLSLVKVKVKERKNGSAQRGTL